MVKNISQRIVFRNTPVSKLYSMYLDSGEHSRITGGKKAVISPVEGADYTANDGGHRGRILQLVRDRLIVQSFFAADWDVDDAESTVVLYFEQQGDDAVIFLTHANVPDRKYEQTDNDWRELYWIPWKKYLGLPR